MGGEKRNTWGWDLMGQKAILVLLPSLEGDGSAVVDIWLQNAHMNTFKKHFYEDIKEQM